MQVTIKNSKFETISKEGEVTILKIAEGDKGEATIKSFAAFLNKLVEMGYGDLNLTANTQDGSSYSVTNSLLIGNGEAEIGD